MEKYRETIKKRVRLFAVLALIFIALLGLSTYQISLSGDTYEDGFLVGFQSGGAVGMIFICIAMVMKYARALKSEEQLKKMHICENDERRKLIWEKSGGHIIIACAIIFIAAAIVTGYFATFEIFVTLYCCAVFLLLTKITLKLYYNRKY
jgi:hypothetical protein